MTPKRAPAEKPSVLAGAHAVHEHLPVGADLAGAPHDAQPCELAPYPARKPMRGRQVIGPGTAQRVPDAISPGRPISAAARARCQRSRRDIAPNRSSGFPQTGPRRVGNVHAVSGRCVSVATMPPRCAHAGRRRAIEGPGSAIRPVTNTRSKTHATSRPNCRSFPNAAMPIDDAVGHGIAQLVRMAGQHELGALSCRHLLHGPFSSLGSRHTFAPKCACEVGLSRMRDHGREARTALCQFVRVFVWNLADPAIGNEQRAPHTLLERMPGDRRYIGAAGGDAHANPRAAAGRCRRCAC